MRVVDQEDRRFMTHQAEWSTHQTHQAETHQADRKGRPYILAIT